MPRRAPSNPNSQNRAAQNRAAQNRAAQNRAAQNRAAQNRAAQNRTVSNRTAQSGGQRRSNRRELSQNFLRDRAVIADMCSLLTGDAPVLELGAGDGALTAELIRSGLEVTAVELDRRLVRRLRSRFGGAARIVHADMLDLRFPVDRYEVISNVPYSITTSVLRTLYRQTGWSRAVLMVQWEVARKRAGATMLTAEWWPWFDAEIVQRVPARSFRPVPHVDSGILVIDRRAAPLLPVSDRRAYQSFVRAVYTGPGAGLFGILRAHVRRAELRRWAVAHDVDLAGLPRDLGPAQWASLYRLASR